MTGVRARWLALVHAFTLNVIFQRLMPFYRLRQTGKSMTLLPSATHIEIASAMTLWIPRHGTSCWEYRRRMTSTNT